MSNMLRAGSNVVHPHDRTYRLKHSSTGHLGMQRLTKAAIAGVIGSVLTGGNIVRGSISAIATFVYNGGYSNLYYRQETYYPTYNTGKGKPTWRKMTRYFYDKNRTKQCGDTIYTQSTILLK